MSDTKYVLVVGDDNNILDLQDVELAPLVDFTLDPTGSPSIAAIFMMDASSAKEFADRCRENGHKVGAYKDIEKARVFMFSSTGSSREDAHVLASSASVIT